MEQPSSSSAVFPISGKLPPPPPLLQKPSILAPFLLEAEGNGGGGGAFDVSSPLLLRSFVTDQRLAFPATSAKNIARRESGEGGRREEKEGRASPLFG